MHILYVRSKQIQPYTHKCLFHHRLAIPQRDMCPPDDQGLQTETIGSMSVPASSVCCEQITKKPR